MPPRIEAELELLRLHYSKVDHVEAGGLHWFRVESVPTTEKWSAQRTPVAFAVTQGYPGAQPYGFYIPSDLTYDRGKPADTGPPHQPPFPGSWLFLSWQPEDWRPTSDVSSGSNLWGWVRGFTGRFKEGR